MEIFLWYDYANLYHLRLTLFTEHMEDHENTFIAQGTSLSKLVSLRSACIWNYRVRLVQLLEPLKLYQRALVSVAVWQSNYEARRCATKQKRKDFGRKNNSDHDIKPYP